MRRTLQANPPPESPLTAPLVTIHDAIRTPATTAVRHSGCDDFEVHGWMSDSTLIVTVQDHGRDAPNPGAGLGTRIIRTLEAVDIEHTQPGTRVTMCFLATPTRRAVVLRPGSACSTSPS